MDGNTVSERIRGIGLPLEFVAQPGEGHRLEDKNRVEDLVRRMPSIDLKPGGLDEEESIGILIRELGSPSPLTLLWQKSLLTSKG